VDSILKHGDSFSSSIDWNIPWGNYYLDITSERSEITLIGNENLTIKVQVMCVGGECKEGIQKLELG
jgi:hypothetical protein